MQTTTLHIKVEPGIARGLRRLAETRRVPVGVLVRQAVSRCYQIDIDGLGERQGRAVAAYQGGYISLGKFAEEMGMHALAARAWLAERDVPQNNSYRDEDAKHA